MSKVINNDNYFLSTLTAHSKDMSNIFKVKLKASFSKYPSFYQSLTESVLLVFFILREEGTTEYGEIILASIRRDDSRM